MEIRLKKSLGQHFLIDENISLQIIKALGQFSYHQVLEVGPGGGALTKYLLQQPGINFKAVELDTEKAVFLHSIFPEIQGKLINDDILNTQPPFEGDFMVIGNFPYNISSQILFKVLEWKEHVPVMVGMFQKEVAQRIASKPGSKIFGILSVLVQAYYTADYLFDVQQNCFNPPPKVMSGVIRLIRKKESTLVKTEDAFFKLVKTAFNQRRKTLRNATKSLFDEETLRNEIFNKRAEQLSIEDFAGLTFKMK
jgi:16S rRNA (adenine1518-N6/adenine1519-N6)-dimethyltransferase